MECEDQDTQQRDFKTHSMYLDVMRRFSQALLKVKMNLNELYEIICHDMARRVNSSKPEH